MFAHLRKQWNEVTALIQLMLSGQLMRTIKIRRQKLTYLSYKALYDIYQTVRHIEQKQLDGVMIEAGCALGGSTLVIAEGKEEKRPLFVYDTFGMIPPPSERDDTDAHKRFETIKSGDAIGIKGDRYYGYHDNLKQQVAQSLTEYGIPPQTNQIELVEGLFEDTLHITHPISFAHIDCDWYDSVTFCLEQIAPKLVKDGKIIIDDYNDWSGCKKAVDHFFADKQNQFQFEYRARLHIKRIK